MKLLKHKADRFITQHGKFFFRHLCRFFAADFHYAACRPVKTAYHIHTGRLSRT